MGGKAIPSPLCKRVHITGEGKYYTPTTSSTGHVIITHQSNVTSSASQCQLLIMVSLEFCCRYLQPAASQALHPWIIHYTAISVWLVKQLSQNTNSSLKVDFARPHLSCHINLPFQFMNKQPIRLSFLFMMYKPKKLA